MIKLTSNLVNETIILQPSFQHMLPDKERMSDLMDTAMNNFYVVGRKWIGKQVRKQTANEFSHTHSESVLPFGLYIGQCLRPRQSIERTIGRRSLATMGSFVHLYDEYVTSLVAR